MSSKRNNKTW